MRITGDRRAGRNRAAIALAVSGVFVLAMTVLADSWGFHDGVGTAWWIAIGWWIVLMLAMVVFWGAVIALVVWFVRGGAAPRDEPPQELVGRRVADGSISGLEYQRRRAALETAGPGSTSSARPGAS